ncbi:MAG TPA: hypothetical protein VFZ43_05310 [Anaerolineales bacterium]
MSQPASGQNEPSKMKKLLNANMDERIKMRLPRANGPVVTTRVVPVSSLPEPEPKRWPFKFMPAFWTIASVISLTVNIILIVILLIVFQMLGAIQHTADAQVTNLLGGLYTNFVKMDQATISTNIPVDATIPLDIDVPVQATTRITLAETAVIQNAHVRINTPTMSINANAVVTLPADTPLTVNLDFPLNVQNDVPVHLDVPVNIPLSQTELHEPFVGLQQVVEPWYCLVEPGATVNGLQVCSQTSSPASMEPATP